MLQVQESGWRAIAHSARARLPRPVRRCLCLRAALRARNRPNLQHRSFGPISSKFGPINVRPNTGNFDRRRPNLARHAPILGQFMPTLLKVNPIWPDFDRIWPDFA